MAAFAVSTKSPISKREQWAATRHFQRHSGSSGAWTPRAAVGAGICRAGSGWAVLSSPCKALLCRTRLWGHSMGTENCCILLGCCLQLGHSCRAGRAWTGGWRAVTSSRGSWRRAGRGRSAGGLGRSSHTASSHPALCPLCEEEYGGTDSFPLTAE